MMDNALPLRHRGRPPRLLLLTSAYFLLGEIKAACQRMEVPHLLVDLATREMTAASFVATMREAFSSFRPDAILTVNHLGVDREGVLYQLARQARLPIVSWFVDNPEFVLPIFPAPDAESTLVLTWDADSIEAVRARGFKNVLWLPLGADPARFRPGREAPADKALEWRSRVSFVANSMLQKTRKRLEAARPSPAQLEAFGPISLEFAASDEGCVAAFLQARRPEMARALAGWDVLRRTAFETAVAWQATLIYRLGCVVRTLPFRPLIAGDPGWADLLAGRTGHRLTGELNYYEELPGFYPLSEVNFNCTSKQMKGAVNQRVFDVPAAGAFLLTDHRRQMEQLFEPGREVIVYSDPEEIPGLLERCLGDPELRRAVAEAGRKRVLAEHTYGHRLSAMLAAMEQTLFGAGGG